MEQKFDTEAIRLMTLFENLTGATVKDCLIDGDILYLVIDEGKVGMAIGKNGNSVKHAEKMTGKTIKLFEYSSVLEKFVKNIIPQISGLTVKEEGDGKVVEIRVEKKDRAVVIGRDGKNLKLFKLLLHRNYGVNDLVVR